MDFIRGSIKQNLGIGIHEKLSDLMENYHHPYTDYYEVLRWAIENRKFWVFDYIIKHDGKSWYDEKINIKSCAHDLIWNFVIGNRKLKYVKSLLKIPGLFSEIELRMDVHHTTEEVEKCDRFRTGKVRYCTIGLYYDKSIEYHNDSIAEEIKKYYEKSLDRIFTLRKHFVYLY